MPVGIGDQCVGAANDIIAKDNALESGNDSPTESAIVADPDLGRRSHRGNHTRTIDPDQVGSGRGKQLATATKGDLSARKPSEPGFAVKHAVGTKLNAPPPAARIAANSAPTKDCSPLGDINVMAENACIHTEETVPYTLPRMASRFINRRVQSLKAYRQPSQQLLAARSALS